jgi:hypothetical protein
MVGNEMLSACEQVEMLHMLQAHRSWRDARGHRGLQVGKDMHGLEPSCMLQTICGRRPQYGKNLMYKRDTTLLLCCMTHGACIRGRGMHRISLNIKSRRS